jgi:integrase
MEYSTVDLWIKKVCGSKGTEKNYLLKIQKFFDYYNINPDELIKTWKQVRHNWTERQKFIDEWSEKVENYYILLADYTPLSKLTTINVVKSFFSHHRIPIEVRTTKHAHVVYRNRDITKSELKRILNHAHLRDRTFFLMMAESGLRPSTLVQLKYRDLREDFENNKVPMKINLRPEIVKDAVADRFTFIGIDGFNSLKEYLSTRELSDDDYIFCKERKNRYNTEYLCPEAFSCAFARIVSKIQLRDIEIKKGKPRRIRLYCLRKFFRKHMKCSDTNFREFWMTHVFGTDQYYISRDVEEHIQQYSEGYKHLRIYEENEQQPNPRLEDLEKKYEELKRENEQLKANDKELKTLREEVEKLKERAFPKMLKKAREMGTVESVEESGKQKVKK